MISPTSTATTPSYPLDLIYGPNGTGKTQFSLTASAQIPAWISAKVALPPPDIIPVELTDLAVIEMDKDGSSGLAELGLSVKYRYDLSSVPAEKLFVELVETLEQGVRPLVNAGTVTGVTLDPITALDAALKTSLIAGTADTRRAYDTLAGRYGKLMAVLKTLQCHVQVLGHQKVANGEEESARRYRMRMEIPEVTFKVTGSGSQLFRDNARFMFYLGREKLAPKDGGGEQVVAWTRRPGYETKLRGGLALPDKVAADWRVIRAEMGR